MQRAGRVDRIGQQAEEVLCYSFMPAEGVEEIINLRERLRARIVESNDLLGSDEAFFTEDEKNQLRDLYAGAASLEEQDDETDLISRAYDIWREAIEADPKLEKKIQRMPNLVYSARKAEAARNDRESAVAYVKTGGGQHILAQVAPDKKIVSQSQWEILSILECAPETPRVEPTENHHDLVKIAVEAAEKNAKIWAGNLGGARAPRRRAYDRMTLIYATEERDFVRAVGRSRRIAPSDASDLRSAVAGKSARPLAPSVGRGRRQRRLGKDDFAHVARKAICASRRPNRPKRATSRVLFARWGL